jgi:hypothetical protein
VCSLFNDGSLDFALVPPILPGEWSINGRRKGAYGLDGELVGDDVLAHSGHANESTSAIDHRLSSLHSEVVVLDDLLHHLDSRQVSEDVSIRQLESRSVRRFIRTR